MKYFYKHIIGLILITIPSALLSQTTGIYNNGATIDILTGVGVNINNGGVPGGYRSETSGNNGAIDLDGTLLISGDWTNNNTAGDGLVNVNTDGTTRFNGAAQNIGGTRGTWFENLLLEGTGDKTITATDGPDDTTRVNGILTLGDRVLNLNGRKIIIENGVPGAITLTTGSVLSESENSKIQWNTNNVWADSIFVFPFGYTDGTYIPFTFRKKILAGTASKISVSTWRTSTDNMTNVPSSTSMDPVKGLEYFIDRWWTVKPNPWIDGRLTFEFCNPCDISEVSGGLVPWAPAEVVTYHWNNWLFTSSGWGWEQIPATSTPTSVTSVWSDYSGGGGGKKGGGPDGPLPIELLFFDAVYNEKTGDVDLEWITASEINNDYFTVERAIDAVDFEKVVNVPGAGNSTQRLNYAAVDEDPYYGISYYRLKQTDYDGKYEYSQIVAVLILKPTDLLVYPNPARDNLTLLYTYQEDADDGALIDIFDVHGKLIYSKHHKLSPVKDGKGAGKFNISLSSFSQGMYFVSFINGNNIYKSKFIKEE